MILAILLGIVLGTGGASVITAVAIIIPCVVGRALLDVLLRKSLITGTESKYVLYVQNLHASGDTPQRSWVGYLVRSCAFFIPVAIAVFW
jgi:putative effector of murein hydrolase